MRGKLDSLDATNTKHLCELEQHLEEYASENEQLRARVDSSSRRLRLLSRTKANILRRSRG